MLTASHTASGDRSAAGQSVPCVAADGAGEGVASAVGGGFGAEVTWKIAMIGEYPIYSEIARGLFVKSM